MLGGDEDDSSYQLAKAKAEGEVTAIIEIERDAKGTITAVRVRSIMAGEADANEDTLESDDVDHSGYVERTVELPVKTDSDRVLADRFLTAMGMPEVAGINVPPGLASQLAGAPDLLGADDRLRTRRAGPWFHHRAVLRSREQHQRRQLRRRGDRQGRRQGRGRDQQPHGDRRPVLGRHEVRALDRMRRVIGR